MNDGKDILEKIPFMPSSKKARAFLLGFAALSASVYFEVEITQEKVVAFLGLFGGYLGSQGMADIGKERALVQAVANAPPDDSDSQ